MPRLSSHARAASPSAPPSAAMADGGESGTPAPSPSTSVPLGLGLGLGLGPAAVDVGSFKYPSMAPPRRSLRLEGAASPTTPTAGSSAPDGGTSGSGSGSGGKSWGWPRVSAPAAAASPKIGELGSDGGGSEVRVSGVAGVGGSSGEGAFTSLRSGYRTAKRLMEPDVHMGGEMGLGLGGGVGAGDQVHDEMLHWDAEGPAKRCKSILVGGIEIEYVTDSESDDDEDCIVLSMRMPMQLSTAPDVIESNVAPLSTYNTDEGRNTDPVKAGIEQFGEVRSTKNDLMSGEFMHIHNSLEMAVDGMIKPLASPVGIPATHEVDELYTDMYFKEEIRRYGSRKGGRGKEKLVLGNNNSGARATVGIRGDARTHKFSPDDKGKGKIVVEESSLSCSSSDDEMVLERVVSEAIQSISRAVDAPVEPLRRQAARERAIALAPKFAFFKADGDVHSDDDDAEDLEPVADPQDWPGPFSTAMRIIDDRDAKLRARELNPSKLDKSADKVILWTPSKDRKTPGPSRPAPSLTSLCLETLSNHAEGIESLAGIPEELKHKLLTSLCHSRKMNNHLLDELLCDNPVTLRLSECSWLGEDDFETIFGKCKTEVLQVLQLDLSGRCMPDYILPATLAKAPNCMPLLTKISLKGNYRLSDNGLDTIISAAPSLSSLNLCECSLLTSTGIENLANKLHSILRELYIDDCLNVEAMMILPALQKVKHLEVLSMSGIQSICDKFVNELIPVHGSNLRELAFAGCLKLTSSSIKTVGGNCPQLSSLDLRNLNRLRDSAMRHLRNGCRLIKKLKLQRNTFSDEAVSQFLEESGGCLTELSLNNVEKAGNLTARAIAHMCSIRLEVLDLSFCRDLTNEALGLIVDSCSSLRILKLFGCTQITDVFLKGHSNSLVKIVGIEGNILEQMDSR